MGGQDPQAHRHRGFAAPAHRRGRPRQRGPVRQGPLHPGPLQRLAGRGVPGGCRNRCHDPGGARRGTGPGGHPQDIRGKGRRHRRAREDGEHRHRGGHGRADNPVRAGGDLWHHPFAGGTAGLLARGGGRQAGRHGAGQPAGRIRPVARRPRGHGGPAEGNPDRLRHQGRRGPPPGRAGSRRHGRGHRARAGSERAGGNHAPGGRRSRRHSRGPYRRLAGTGRPDPAGKRRGRGAARPHGRNRHRHGPDERHGHGDRPQRHPGRRRLQVHPRRSPEGRAGGADRRAVHLAGA